MNAEARPSDLPATPSETGPQASSIEALRSTLEASEARVRELELRLAQVHDHLTRARVDEETGELQEDAGGLLSALDYALRGHPGCVEPEEFEADRATALEAHRDDLGLAALSDRGEDG